MDGQNRKHFNFKIREGGGKVRLGVLRIIPCFACLAIIINPSNIFIVFKINEGEGDFPPISLLRGLILPFLTLWGKPNLNLSTRKPLPLFKKKIKNKRGGYLCSKSISRDSANFLNSLKF